MASNNKWIEIINNYEQLDDSLKLNIKSLLLSANRLFDSSNTNNRIDLLKAILYIITSDDAIEPKTFIRVTSYIFNNFQNEKFKTKSNAKQLFETTRNLINEEIKFFESLKSEESKLKKQAVSELNKLNSKIFHHINESSKYDYQDEYDNFKFFPFYNEELEELLSKNNVEEISRWEFYHPYIILIFSYIANSKLLFYIDLFKELNRDYYLSKVRIALWSLGLVNAINYSKGQFSLLTKAQLYFTYEIIRIFINNIKDNENFNLDNIKNIFTFPPTRNKTIPQLPNSQLAKRLNCLLFGYLVKSCYCLDSECDINKSTIKSLIKSCKYREENKELSQFYTVCNCRKYSSGSEFCEFYNIVNQWLQDYEPIGIELKQTELIYFFDLDIDPAAFNRYLKGNTKKVSPSFLNDFSVKTGIPKKYLTDKNKDTVHGLNMFYYKLNFLTLISVQDIYLFRKQFSQHFKDWSKNPTPKRYEISEGTNIKTYLNKADMNIIYTVLKVLKEKPHLKDIQIYKKTADKIEYLLKEANKTF